MTVVKRAMVKRAMVKRAMVKRAMVKRAMVKRAMVAALFGLLTLVVAPISGHADPTDPDEELPVSSCTSPRTLASQYVASMQATIRLRYSAVCGRYWANATLDSYSGNYPGCDGIEIRIRVQSGESGPHGVVLQAERIKSDLTLGCSGTPSNVIATPGVDRFSSRIIGRACVWKEGGSPTYWVCTNWHNV